jgi:hypothetical protein
MAAWLDGKRLRELVAELPPENGTEPSKVLTALGLDGLDALAFEFGLAGERIETVITVAAPAPRRGLLKLLDQEPFTLAELPPLPAEGGFYAFSLDLADLYHETLETVRRVIDVSDPNPEAAASMDAGLAQMRAVLGFDPETDLLAHLGHVGVLYSEGGRGGIGSLAMPLMATVAFQSAAGDGGAGMPGPFELGLIGSMVAMGGFNGFNSAVALEVKDADALGKTLEKLDKALTTLAQGRLTIDQRERAGTTMKLYRRKSRGST